MGSDSAIVGRTGWAVHRVVWWGFLGGIHFTCLLAGGIPKLGDLGVEGHPASAQVNARVLQQGVLTLGLYDRKV